MILRADARAIPLRDESVQCVVTSPPYWGLRDYGTPGQLGLCKTPEEYVAAMVSVFREVRRVLKDDGVVFLNLGDSYFGGGGYCPTAPSSATSKSGKYGKTGALIAGHTAGSRRAGACGTSGKEPEGSKDHGCLCGNLCDACRRAYQIGKSHNGSRLAPMPEPSPSLPTREHTGSQNGHFPTSGSLNRVDHSVIATPDPVRIADHEGEPPPVSHQTTTAHLKSKDLVGVPWRVAFALQADGWYLRSDIIWSKPNPMPESVTDRPTKAHEYIFLLTKSSRYYYNAEAIFEPALEGTDLGILRGKNAGGPGADKIAWHANSIRARQDAGVDSRTANTRVLKSETSPRPVSARNKRTVWSIATQPYAGSHFATFPEEIPRLCILAGSRPGDVILDPFGGSGTTSKVALELGRKPVHIDLTYHELARKRMTTTPAMVGLMG